MSGFPASGSVNTAGRMCGKTVRAPGRGGSLAVRHQCCWGCLPETYSQSTLTHAWSGGSPGLTPDWGAMNMLAPGEGESVLFRGVTSGRLPSSSGWLRAHVHIHGQHWLASVSYKEREQEIGRRMGGSEKSWLGNEGQIILKQIVHVWNYQIMNKLKETFTIDKI